MLRRIGRNRKVGIFARVVIDGKRKQWSAEMEGNSSLKPVPGGVFWLKWLQHGKSKYRCVGSDPAFAARARLQQEAVLARQAGAETLSIGSRRTLRAAVEIYLANVEAHKKKATYTAYKNTLEKFLSVTRAQYFDEVGRQHVLDFILWLRQQKRYAPRSIYNYTENLVAFLKAGVDGAELPSPLRRGDWPKYQEKRVTTYSIKDIAALRAAAIDRERLVLEAFLATGFRKSELANLRWADVDLSNALIYAQEKPGSTTEDYTTEDYSTKDYEQRILPLEEPLLPMLVARRSAQPDDVYVFPNKNGGPNNHLDRVLHRIAKRAGVNLSGKRILHDLRKTFSTRMNRSGTDIETLRVMLGHSNLSTTQRYLSAMDPDDQKLRAQMRAAMA
jgi:integrase